MFRPSPLFTLGFLVGAVVQLTAAPLRVGIDLDGEPMTSVNARGKPQGFAVEIVNAVAHEMGLEVVYVPKHWPEMMEDFSAGRTDMLADITYTEERAKFMDFSAPHMVMNTAIFLRKDGAPLKSAAALRDRRIAVKLGGAPHHYLVSHGWSEHIVPAATLRDALRALEDGRADAVLDARITAMKHIRADKLMNIVTSDVDVLDFAQRLHVAFQLGNTERVAMFNDGLARLHANGSYDKIYDKWIGPLETSRVRLRQLQPYFLPSGIVFAFIVGIFFWQRHLLRRLARQAQALSQSEERLTFVLEGSNDGFWDWDMRAGRVQRSERWASMLGFTLAEIPATPEGGAALVHPDDRSLYDLFHARTNTPEHTPQEIEYRMRTKSGDWRWILDRGKVVAWAGDGSPLRMAGTHTDITDLKRAREEAARQQSRFRFIYEHAPIGLSWLRQGAPETRLVNPAHERITGVPASRAHDTASYVVATHPEDRERQRLLQEQAYAGIINHFSMEKRYVHPGGRIVWAMLSMHVLRNAADGDLQEVTTLVDLTDLKRTEAEREKLGLKMLEAQKLESLGVLAGGIAHDFNNLLTVILANASLVRDDTEPIEDRIVHIVTADRRAADLCRQMLAYAGQGSFLVEKVELGSLVQETAELLHVSISKKARLELRLAPDLPAVEADASQLRQVVMNLVINASEALGDSPGEIHVSTRLGRPDATPRAVTHSFDLPPGECVCLEISDTGEGMSDATVARIFDPFFSTKFTGRGLGLAAVLGIVRAHEGALTVRSTPGAGTTFQLYLPVRKTASPAARPPTPPRAAARGTGTLLIADDEPSVLATIDSMLRRNGYQTVLATSGDEAVARFTEDADRFAGVLVDLTMPGLNGVETVRAIRLKRPSIQVLVMSGFSEKDIVDRLRGVADVSILRKPFIPDALLSAVAQLIAASA